MNASCDSAPSYSSYYQTLDATAGQCCKEKLGLLRGLEDPYLHSEFSEDWKNWPEMEYPDVYNFLIQTPSLYTGESLKANKSLDACNQYINGWIKKATVFKIPTCAGTYMVLGRVKHSQSLSATPAKPWVAIKAKGTVVCAHCTSMAGLGEACSHLAALLFMMEGNTQHKMRMACTSWPCYWLPPSFREVPYSQLADMDFVTPKKERSEPCNQSCRCH